MNAAERRAERLRSALEDIVALPMQATTMEQASQAIDDRAQEALRADDLVFGRLIRAAGDQHPATAELIAARERRRADRKTGA